MRTINTRETYEQQLAEAIWEWLKFNCEPQALLDDNCGCFEDVYDTLYDELICDDYITGNASGSYTFCRETAKEMVLNNVKDVIWALTEYGMLDSLGRMLEREDWERIDVITRCYYMGEILREQLEMFLGGCDYE